ncbi:MULTISPECIES: antitoxin Xre/MbcA/ParS toxin-binding domain-containing protein [Sphingobium]
MHEFMRHPHPMLGGESPIVCAVSSKAGADRVMNMLGRAAHSGGV